MEFIHAPDSNHPPKLACTSLQSTVSLADASWTYEVTNTSDDKCATTWFSWIAKTKVRVVFVTKLLSLSLVE